MMPRITAFTASDIMVLVHFDWKSRALLAYSPPCRNRKKTSEHHCLARLLG
jgi:hypothetical protein